MSVTPFLEEKSIEEFHIYDGDLPSINYEYKEGKLYAYNRINGSRDGYMQFPDGFFDTVEIKIDDVQRQQLFVQLSMLNLRSWKTGENVFEKMDWPAGFCVNQKFSCKFDNGEEFVCYPIGTAPREFEKLFALLKSFGLPNTYTGREIQKIEAKNIIKDPNVIDLNPNCTTLLFSVDEGVRLFSENRGEDIWIYKTEFLAGRSKESSLHMSSNVISRMHATFMFDGSDWLLRDNHSANGTWLNETKLMPGKKYVLRPNDVIDFAHAEKFTFCRLCTF